VHSMELKITAMTCKQFVKPATRAPKDVPGATSVEVGLESGRAFAIGAADRDILLGAIEREGHHVLSQRKPRRSRRSARHPEQQRARSQAEGPARAASGTEQAAPDGPDRALANMAVRRAPVKDMRRPFRASLSREPRNDCSYVLTVQ